MNYLVNAKKEIKNLTLINKAIVKHLDSRRYANAIIVGNKFYSELSKLMKSEEEAPPHNGDIISSLGNYLRYRQFSIISSKSVLGRDIVFANLYF